MEQALKEPTCAIRAAAAARDVTNATVVFRDDVTAELAVVRVRPDHGSAPPFEPGQFTLLGLPPAPTRAPREEPAARPRRLLRRAYSITSPSTDLSYLEFYVALVEHGQLSPQLWSVPRGGRLWMDSKVSGRFTLSGVPTDRDILMVATGTGIAPFVSMLRTYHGTGRWRHAVLVHGVRRATDLAYRGELEALAGSGSDFTYLPTVSREPERSPWLGLRGRVQEVLEDGTYDELVGRPLDPSRWHAFVCGSPEMIESVRETLSERGFSTGGGSERRNLHFERYW